MRVPRTLLGRHGRGGARAERRDPAGRHPQPARRSRDHGHQRRRGGRDRRSGSCCSATQTAGAYIWLAFLGAGVATVLVYGIASFGREGATPVKLALAGAAVTAGLTSVTTGDRHDQRRCAQRAALLAGRLARRPLHAGLLADAAVHRRSASCGRARVGTGAERARARRGRRARARPARPADAASCCSRPWPCSAARRRRPAARSSSSASSSPTSRACSAGPTTAGSCPTRCVLAPIGAAARGHRRPRRRLARRAAGRRRARRARRAGVRRSSSATATWRSCEMADARPIAASRARVVAAHRAARRRRALIGHDGARRSSRSALFVVTMMVGSYGARPVGGRSRRRSTCATTRRSTSSCATCGCRPR